MGFINIKFPLVDDVEKNKAFQMNSVTKEALSSNLILLLLTKKGERYYEPNYGTNLIQYIFEPKDTLTITEIEAELKDTVKTFIPEVTISNVEIFNQFDDNGIEIKENELRVHIDFVYTENTFVEKGRLELNF
jgi:phage baseplate assembly protein W